MKCFFARFAAATTVQEFLFFRNWQNQKVVRKPIGFTEDMSAKKNIETRCAKLESSACEIAKLCAIAFLWNRSCRSIGLN